MNSRLLILTEAGDNIGFGHYTRCSAIAQAWAEDGTVEMLLDLKGEQILSVPHGQIFAWLAQLEAVCERASEFDVVLVDSYLAQASDFEQLAAAFPFVAEIDDYQRLVYPIDLVLNPNVHGDLLDTTSQTAQWIGGKDYIILRDAFRSTVDAPIQLRDQIKTVALTVGGSDYRSLLHPLTKLLVEYGYQALVLTGHPDRKAAIESAFANEAVEAFGMLNADEMYHAFDRADLVLTAAGQTLHELASMGKPTIAVCIDHDQENNIEFYSRAGFLPGRIDWDQKGLESAILEQLRRFEDIELRLNSAEAGKATIDGKGVENIVTLLRQSKRVEA